MKKALALFLLLAVALAACTPPAGPQPEAPTAAVIISVSPTSPASTATPSLVPPTDTPEPTPTDEPTITPTPLPEDYGPDNFPDEVDPLTGLQVVDPTRLDRRPIAIKVQLYPRGQRPVWGVSLADITYEYYQNNGLTRLHTIFYSQDAEQAGPIRSARLLDKYLVPMYGSIFAFGGADARILGQLTASQFGDRLMLEGTQNSKVLFRVEPDGPNLLMTNTGELSSHAADIGINNDRQALSGMTFQLDAPDGGDPGVQAYSRYSISAYSRWEYDPDSGRYLRFQDSAEASTLQDEVFTPLEDGLTNQQIAADNVIFLLVPQQDTLPSANAEIIDIQLTGKGAAYAFRDGQAYEVTWNAAPESVLYLTGSDGKPFPFKQGSTWFQVIGQTSTVNDQEKADGVWRFESKLP